MLAYTATIFMKSEERVGITVSPHSTAICNEKLQTLLSKLEKQEISAPNFARISAE
jgi:hypothetical protein